MKKILMTHLYYGDPNEKFSLELAKTLIESGADILEIGIPYTDPVCDGEIFQRACCRSLGNGMTPYKVLEGIIKLRRKGVKSPIYLTSYYAPIFKLGEYEFVKSAKEAGADGLIVPDLLLEEQKVLRRYADRMGLTLIQFATVYSTEDRLKVIISQSTDFIYCIALPGVTGDRGDSSKLIKLVKLIKSISKKPIYVGFGIKKASGAKEIIKMGADGIIVGSAIAGIYEKNINEPDKSLPEIMKFIKGLKESMIKVGT